MVKNILDVESYQKVFSILKQLSSGGEMTLTSLMKLTQIPKATLDFKIKNLKEIGIVDTEIRLIESKGVKFVHIVPEKFRAWKKSLLEIINSIEI